MFYCSHYDDICRLLDALFPTDRHCPRVLRRYGVRCRCPFNTGLLDLVRYSFRVPRFSGFMKTLAVVSYNTVDMCNVLLLFLHCVTILTINFDLTRFDRLK